MLHALCIISLLLTFTLPVWTLEAVQPTLHNESQGSWLIARPSDQDVFLLISSIEWGSPDRWSFTSRFVHMFNKDRTNRTWLNNLTFTLCPGTDGGRLGLGYQGILTSRSMIGMTLLNEIRVDLLRTWGNPIATASGRTFVGVELRSSFAGIFNLGTGYYTQISATSDRQGLFWRFHIGVGI